MVKFLKAVNEFRDNELWEMTLRQDKVEKHLAELKRNVNLTNTYETAESCNTGVNEREIDSL